MKRKITVDEFYPIYYIGDDEGEVELSLEEYEEFTKNWDEFWKLQKLLSTRLAEARKISDADISQLTFGKIKPNEIELINKETGETRIVPCDARYIRQLRKSMDLPSGWLRKKLTDDKWQITIPKMDAGVRQTGELWVKTNYPFEVGDWIVIEGRVDGPITKCNHIDCEDAYLLTVKSDKDVYWEMIRR